MLDNQLFAIIISTLIAGESAAGIANTPIKQAFQPTQQGVNTGPTAYIYKIGDARVGSPARTDKYDSDLGRMVHTELQQYETTFQISTLATQDPKTPSKYTASDILNLIAYILQSSATIAHLEAQGIGILRVRSLSNTYFMDDRHRNEAAPALEFVLTHKQIITTSVPAVRTVEARILTV